MTHARRGIGAWTVGLACVVVIGILAGAEAPAQTLDVERIGQSLGAGARGLGMGGAFAAVADDATAPTWNPAGATELDKPTVSVGYAPWSRIRRDHPAIVESGYQLGAYQEAASSRVFDHGSAALPFKLGSLRLVALGAYQRAVDMGWERDYTLPYGPESAGETLPNAVSYTSNESGGLDVWSAGLGVRLGQHASFGATLDVWTGDALSKSSERDEAEGSALWIEETVDQSLSGIGAKVGLLIRPSPTLRLAAVVRAPFKMTYRYTSTSVFEAPRHSISEEIRKDGSFDWPLAGTLGVAYRPREELTIAADVTIARWSDAVYGHTYHFVVTTAREGLPEERTELDGDRRQTWPLFGDPDDPEDPNHQSDTMQARLGVEYAIAVREGVTVPIRAGGFLDRQLALDGFGDAVRATGVTLGIGVRAPYVGFDVAWAYERGRMAFKAPTDELEQASHRLLVSATLRP